MTLQDRYFPFYRYNLTQNPFGTLSESEQFRVTVPPEPIAAALKQGFQHLLVLGRQGRGKSTALKYVAAHLRAHGETVVYERLPHGRWDYTKSLAGADAFALDEMQRCAPWVTLRLMHMARHGLRLVVGSHWNHTPAFWLHGLEVTVVRLGQQASRARLEQVLTRRLDIFRRDPSQPPAITFSDGALDWLWKTYHGDLRNMNFFLYDVFREIDAPGPVTAVQLQDFADKNPAARRQT